MATRKKTRPAIIDAFAADFAVRTTGPGTVTFKMHGRETTQTVAEVRRNLRKIRPAIDWLLEEIEAVCVEAAAKGTGRPRR